MKPAAFALLLCALACRRAATAAPRPALRLQSRHPRRKLPRHPGELRLHPLRSAGLAQGCTPGRHSRPGGCRLTITRDGAVIAPRAISSHPALIPAALAAVSRWRLAPCRIPGDPDPIERRAAARLSFTLNR